MIALVRVCACVRTLVRVCAYAWERVSPVTGVARFSGALSLGVVLVYAMVLEAVQDWRRYRQDQQINGALCRVLSEGGSGWETIRWRQRLYEDMCIEIARANYAMLKERTLPPRVA